MSARAQLPEQDPPLSILQIGTQFNLGGIPKHMLTLSQSLREAGDKVVLSGTAGRWCGPDVDPGFLDLPIRYVASEGGSLPARLGHLATSSGRLWNWLRKNHVDLIHAHESAPALVSMMARVGRRIPVAVTYHGSEPERVTVFSKTARHCDLVITPSHASARDLIEVGGIPEERVKVIGLGVPPVPDYSADDVKELRRQLLKDGDRLLVTVARLADQKGIDVLIECARKLKHSHPGYRFAIVGDGPLREEYTALAAEMDVLSHLQFVGRTEEVHKYLMASDLFLLTSRYEALPFSIVEAFQVGVPAVATACSGVVELIDETVGKTVEIGNVDAICDAVIEVLEDPRRLDRMGQAALEKSGKPRFDPEYNRVQMRMAYRELINKRTRTAAGQPLR